MNLSTNISSRKVFIRHKKKIHFSISYECRDKKVSISKQLPSVIPEAPSGQKEVM